MAPGTLTVKFCNGSLTHDTDLIGKMDPYVKAWLGSQEFRTKTASSQGKHPRWDETKTFSVTNEQELRLECWDYDTIGKDDLIGKGEVNLNALPPGASSLDVPLTYGNNKSAGTIRLEFNYVVAGGVQGAVMQGNQALSARMHPDGKAAAAGLGGGTLEAKIISASLTHDTELMGQMDPYFKVFLGTSEKRTRVIKRGGKRPVWDQTLTFPMAGEEMIRFECWDEETLGMDDSVGSGSFNIRTLPPGKTKVEVPLKFQGQSAGVLHVEFTKILPGTSAQGATALKAGPSNLAPRELGAVADRAGMASGTLMLRLISAMLSRDTDPLGKMDPYIKIFVGGEEKKTTTARGHGRKPRWNESFTFKVAANDSVRFEIWDYDTIGDDDLICEGVATIRGLPPGVMMHDIPLTYEGQQAGSLQLETNWMPGAADMGGPPLMGGMPQMGPGMGMRNPDLMIRPEPFDERLPRQPIIREADYSPTNSSPMLRGPGLMGETSFGQMPMNNNMMGMNGMGNMNVMGNMNGMGNMNPMNNMMPFDRELMMNRERERDMMMMNQMSRSQTLPTSMYTGGPLPFPGMASPNPNPVNPIMNRGNFFGNMMDASPMTPMSPMSMGSPYGMRGMGGMGGSMNDMGGPRWNAPIVTDRKTLKMVTEQVFWTFDYGRRGKLEYYEFYPAFCELCRRMGCQPPSMQQIWFIMQRFDNNLDRRISYKEFKSIAKELFGHYHKRGRYAYY